MAQDKRHLTTEQLSALLDREASAEEQAQWEAHLSTCPQCQRALNALRQTVTMLHALPQPKLTRSFVLPVEAAEPILPSVTAVPTPIRPTRRRLNPYLRGVLRTMSALAAMIGVVFFLSGVLPALRSAGGATATAGSSVALPAKSPAHVVAGTKSSNADHPNTLSPIVTATALVEPQPPNTTYQPADGTTQPSPSLGFTFLIFNLSTAAGRVGLGMILVLLGGMGFILFKRSRRVR